MAEIPENVKKGLEIVPVTTVDEVLEHALAGPLTPIEWDEEKADLDARALGSGTGEDDDVGGVVTH